MNGQYLRLAVEGAAGDGGDVVCHFVGVGDGVRNDDVSGLLSVLADGDQAGHGGRARAAITVAQHVSVGVRHIDVYGRETEPRIKIFRDLKQYSHISIC